jgi:hypothetical protein
MALFRCSQFKFCGTQVFAAQDLHFASQNRHQAKTGSMCAGGECAGGEYVRFPTMLDKPLPITAMENQEPFQFPRKTQSHSLNSSLRATDRLGNSSSQYRSFLLPNVPPLEINSKKKSK